MAVAGVQVIKTEILIVLSILGIVGGIATISYKGYNLSVQKKDLKLSGEPALSDVQSLTGVCLKRVFVDKGYRGEKHHPEGLEVNVSGQRPSPSRYHRRLARRRNSVEAVIGHLKGDCRMERNFLHGELGDGVNALLSGSGYNIRRLIREVNGLPSFFVLFIKRFFTMLFCFSAKP